MRERSQSSDVAALAAQVAELRERVTRLEQSEQVEHSPRRIRRSGLRDEDDAAVFRAIARSVGATGFSARHVRDHAEKTADADLLKALAAADCDSSARSLGKLLARVEGRTIDGLVLVRVHAGGSGIRWRIEPA